MGFRIDQRSAWLNLKIKPFPLLFCHLLQARNSGALPSGAPYSYGKQKETHELIFSWLSWLAVLLVGAYARWRRRSRQVSKTTDWLRNFYKNACAQRWPLTYCGDWKRSQKSSENKRCEIERSLNGILSCCWFLLGQFVRIFAVLLTGTCEERLGCWRTAWN